MNDSEQNCAACGNPAALDSDGAPLHTIHRDGFDDGPEVPLCDDCGSHETPSCDALWRMIAGRRLP